MWWVSFKCQLDRCGSTSSLDLWGEAAPTEEISALSSVGTNQPRRDPNRTKKKREENDAWGICPRLPPSTRAPGFQEFYMDHLPWGQAKDETGIWFRAETLAGEGGSFHIVDIRESCDGLWPLSSQHLLFSNFPADQCHIITIHNAACPFPVYTFFVFTDCSLFIFFIVWGSQESNSHSFFLLLSTWVAQNT